MADDEGVVAGQGLCSANSHQAVTGLSDVGDHYAAILDDREGDRLRLALPQFGKPVTQTRLLEPPPSRRMHIGPTGFLALRPLPSSTFEDAVTITQFRTLVVLEGHGDSQLNQLAERLGVTPSTMRTVGRLIAAHLVTREGNKADRREVLIGLTHEGKRLVREVTARRRAEIAIIVAAMPQEGPASTSSRRLTPSPKPPATPHRASTPPPGSAGNHGRLVPPLNKSIAPPRAGYCARGSPSTGKILRRGDAGWPGSRQSELMNRARRPGESLMVVEHQAIQLALADWRGPAQSACSDLRPPGWPRLVRSDAGRRLAWFQPPGEGNHAARNRERT